MSDSTTDSISSWIAAAVAHLGLASQIHRLQEPMQSEVITRITTAFLTNKRATFWWDCLSVTAGFWQTNNGYRHLPLVAPDPQADCWLIAGLEDNQKSVFRCTPNIAAAIIGECPAFEYAIVDMDLTYMIIENHHDMLIAVGTAMERLNQVRTPAS